MRRRLIPRASKTYLQLAGDALEEGRRSYYAVVDLSRLPRLHQLVLKLELRLLKLGRKKTQQKNNKNTTETKREREKNRRNSGRTFPLSTHAGGGTQNKTTGTLPSAGRCDQAPEKKTTCSAAFGRQNRELYKKGMFKKAACHHQPPLISERDPESRTTGHAIPSPTLTRGGEHTTESITNTAAQYAMVKAGCSQHSYSSRATHTVLLGVVDKTTV